MRIVGLNTNLYYTSNKQTGTTEDPAGQFVWLGQVLEAAKIANETVCILKRYYMFSHFDTDGLINLFTRLGCGSLFIVDHIVSYRSLHSCSLVFDG